MPLPASTLSSPSFRSAGGLIGVVAASKFDRVGAVAVLNHIDIVAAGKNVIAVTEVDGPETVPVFVTVSMPLPPFRG